MSSHTYLRYHALDLLRGVAVLAILIVNIWSFSMPFSAYSNPTMHGDLTGANYVVWLFSYVLVQEKFITVFSILFGAGIALFVDHAERKGASVATLHFRRMAVLLAIGIGHAYLLWYGDILTAYALLGMLAFVAVHWRNRSLVIAAAGLIVIQILLLLLLAVSLPYMPPESVAELQATWAPALADRSAEIAHYQGNWFQQQQSRLPMAIELQQMVLSFYGVRLLAHMLIGMLLYRSGFLTGSWSRARYLLVAGFGLLIGLPLALAGALQLSAANFAMEQAFGFGALWNNAASLLMAFGYMALLIYWQKGTAGRGVCQALQNAGRMAFTLYLGSTLLATTLFYGHGFGLFGQLDRWQLLMVVLLIWSILLTFANWWLRSHRQGPLEALWRRLTYGTAAND